MFIREDSAATIRHVLWPHNSEHFGVVGEQYREETVRRMKDDIRLTARLCPQSVLIAEDDNNPHDDKAVAVMYPFEKKTSPTGVPGVVAEVVGYLPREEARRFRTAMKRIDMSGRPLEVCGCVVSMPDRPFDNVKVYLPRNFANLVAKGTRLIRRTPPRGLWMIHQLKSGRTKMTMARATCDDFIAATRRFMRGTACHT
jgi:hypothetical protein